MFKPKFDPTINLGHVLIVLGAGLTGYVSVVNMERALDKEVAIRVEQQKATNIKIEEVRNAVINLDGRLFQFIAAQLTIKRGNTQ